MCFWCYDTSLCYYNYNALDLNCILASDSVVGCCGSFNMGVWPIATHSYSKMCSGLEERISRCSYDYTYYNSIIKNQPVGVRCQQGKPWKSYTACKYSSQSIMLYSSGEEFRDGDLRLNGSTDPWKGRVEVYLSGEWGTISSIGAYSSEADFICRQLGYSLYCKCRLL